MGSNFLKMTFIFTVLSFALIAKGIKVDGWYYILGGAITSIAASICYYTSKLVEIYNDDEENNTNVY